MNRKTEARHAVLDYLVERSAVSFAASSIWRAINRVGGDYTLEEIVDACELLVGVQEVLSIRDRLGSDIYYKAAAAGVLAHERGRS